MNRKIILSILLFVPTASCFGADADREDVLLLTDDQMNEINGLYEKAKKDDDLPKYKGKELKPSNFLDKALDCFLESKKCSSISVATVKGRLPVIKEGDECNEDDSFLSAYATGKIVESKTVPFKSLPFKSLQDFQKVFTPIVLEQYQKSNFLYEEV